VVVAAKWAVDLWLPAVVAGVAAVALTRVSAGIERRAWRRDVRRDVYARFLSSAAKLQELRIQRAVALKHSADHDEVDRLMIQEWATLEGAMAEVRLHGSDEVIEMARTMADRCESAGEPTADELDEDIEVAEAMRADLR